MKDPNVLRIEDEFRNFIIYGIDKLPKNSTDLEKIENYSESLVKMIIVLEYEFIHIDNPIYKLMGHLHDVQDELIYDYKRAALNSNRN